MAAFEARHFTQAMKLLSPLAETGLAQAQYRLAIMYQNGLGVVRNELLAYKWMKSAAQQDYGPALHGLGFMYMDGDCAAQDDARAFQWFEAAAEQGLAGAMVALAQICISTTADRLPNTSSTYSQHINLLLREVKLGAVLISSEDPTHCTLWVQFDFSSVADDLGQQN